MPLFDPARALWRKHVDKTDPKLPEKLNLNLSLDEWLGLNTPSDRSALLMPPKLHPPANTNDRPGTLTLGTWHGHAVELHAYTQQPLAYRLGLVDAKQDALTHDRNITPMLGITFR
jgi:hypothetical protein